MPPTSSSPSLLRALKRDSICAGTFVDGSWENFGPFQRRRKRSSSFKTRASGCPIRSRREKFPTEGRRGDHRRLRAPLLIPQIPRRYRVTQLKSRAMVRVQVTNTLPVWMILSRFCRLTADTVVTS